MSGRYLLYIDILGFVEIMSSDTSKVEHIYAILDSLNVHQHNAFKTIVFSDTVLVYNPKLARSENDKSYLVWYLIEFAEDLHHRLTGQDVFFRAILTTGNFTHYHLENIECFFGDALIDAHLREKKIPSVGLFIDSRCNKFNRYFRVEAFNPDLFFVYLNRSLESLNEYSGGKFPVEEPAISDLTPHVPWQVRFLKDVHKQMRTHPDPHVRAKHLTAWDFYKKRYPEMLEALEKSNFSLSCLATGYAWTDQEKTMDGDIRHFAALKGKRSNPHLEPGRLG